MLGLGAPLAEHMGLHIALMNIAAPILASILIRITSAAPPSGCYVAVSFLLQQAALWFWHAPPILNDALLDSGRVPMMHASLFLAALWFWVEVFRARQRWQAILSLVASAKLFCLLGVLMTLAPRVFYAVPLMHHGSAIELRGDLADQQLAGLLMLTACPLTYLAVATGLAARWLSPAGTS